MHQRCENKRNQQQNVTSVSILNLGPEPFGSDALLSESLRHVLLGSFVRSLHGYAALVLTK